MIRTILLYTLVVTVMRLMGKRQIGQLQPYELAITIMLSDLACLPMQDTRLPLILGIIPIVTLLAVETIVSEIQLKSNIARKIIDGCPCVVIENGKINIDVLKKQRINLDDLMESLRLAGYLNIGDVQFAIIENNGQLSIIPNDANSPIVKKDLNLDSNNNQKLPSILVVEGKINKSALKKLNKSENWIYNYLQLRGIDDIKKIYIALIDSNGQFYYETIEDGMKESEGF